MVDRTRESSSNTPTRCMQFRSLLACVARVLDQATGIEVLRFCDRWPSRLVSSLFPIYHFLRVSCLICCYAPKRQKRSERKAERRNDAIGGPEAREECADRRGPRASHVKRRASVLGHWASCNGIGKDAHVLCLSGAGRPGRHAPTNHNRGELRGSPAHLETTPRRAPNPTASVVCGSRAACSADPTAPKRKPVKG